MLRIRIVYPEICFTTEENHWTHLSELPKYARLISTERGSFSRYVHRGRSPRPASWPKLPWKVIRHMCQQLVSAKTYLASCRTRRFSTSANFQSKFSVRALMQTQIAEHHGPRVSAVTYKRAQASKKRNITRHTCSLCKQLRLANLHAGQAYFFRGRMSWQHWTTPFLTERSLFSFKRAQAQPFFEQPSS